MRPPRSSCSRPTATPTSIDRTRSPFELDLGRLVDCSKPNFTGRRALLEEQKKGSRFRLVKLDIEGNKLARAAYIYNRNDSSKQVVGTVTSAVWSPAGNVLESGSGSAIHDGFHSPCPNPPAKPSF